MKDTRRCVATGKWEVEPSSYSSFYEGLYSLLAPDGSVHSTWHSQGGYWQAIGYRDTYNKNRDKAPVFRRCPYCKTRCPWCD
jgi:hypothetical protein